MKDACRENLSQLAQLVAGLSPEQYCSRSEVLSGSTVGQHVRHIIEFYLCLIKGTNDGIINYDDRERNQEMELFPEVAIEAIDIIVNFLEGQAIQQIQYLMGNFSKTPGKVITIPTSFQRELAYCLEHAIHHQALIKAGLKDLGLETLIDPGFGIAPATQRHNHNSR